MRKSEGRWAGRRWEMCSSRCAAENLAKSNREIEEKK